MHSSRLIHLRRPPVLSITREPFVPQRMSMEEVDRRWSTLRAGNPAYFDGRIWHVLGVSRNGHGGATIHVQECGYRFYAVQNEEVDIGTRVLGVKGFTWRDDRVLLGLRASFVSCYPEMWEFAPGGAADVGIDPAHTIEDELREETGLTPTSEPVAIAVMYDPTARTWEIIFRIVANPGELHSAHREYTSFEWRPARDLPSNLTPIARNMTRLL
jgi:8-oxo-dGTP pyrophosphatase MutT (NUDIX family)